MNWSATTRGDKVMHIGAFFIAASAFVFFRVVRGSTPPSLQGGWAFSQKLIEVYWYGISFKSETRSTPGR